MTVKRGFVDIDEGQVHYRYKGAAEDVPLVMLHPGPTSAHAIVPLIERVGEKRQVIAPDLLGMGDSAAPAHDETDMAYFADAALRTLDSMGVQSFDLWGSMTGAHCAIEVAIMQPKRVRRLYVEMLLDYDEATEKALQQGHAPKIAVDQIGSQLNLLWHLARDQHLFFPWFTRDAAHARNNGLPTAKQLHEKTVELLKACGTYHVPLNAALRHKSGERLAKVTVPVIGPEWFQKYLPSATVRGDFCVGPSTAPTEQVEKSAAEILRQLG
ncbi:MAG: alpha/beta fold hydrolase [Alphaproteobacteria bacterium]|jgi:pimeloyl-ACP methyl ester carboxylesterase